MNNISTSNSIDNTSNRPRSDTIDLNDQSLQVDISDALSEKDRVKFTIHSKTNMPEFDKNDFSVVRQHEEFLWLHDTISNNELYLGYIIPPPPPKPDFDASRDKLQKLSDDEEIMTESEFNKMKEELEAEYLATFKKTVAMHEIFLQRLAAHPEFKTDSSFRIFLQYENDLSVRGKNKREKLADMFYSLSKSADDMVLFNTQKDIDEFFEHERLFINEYLNHIRECTLKADTMTKNHKSVADSYIKISSGLMQLASAENSNLKQFLIKVAECLEKARKFEGKAASDEDLKLSDTLRYYMRDTNAAKSLLYRRSKCLHNYEIANRNLDKARKNNKDVSIAENQQQEACEKYEKISKLAKQELSDFKVRRVAAFKKNFIDFVELQIKDAKVTFNLIYAYFFVVVLFITQ